MAKEYSLTIAGQPCFSGQDRRMIEVFYTEPEGGVGEETGILLLIAGFDGHVQANVYQKMRREFADRENLVVAQCAYFGSRFMGADTMAAVHSKMASMALELYEKTCREEKVSYGQCIGTLELEESPEDFCEMGLFQALDNLRAVKSVMELLDCRGETYNRNRIIAYGYSHGGYLALLCNALAPWVFSGIIDNSGWVYPVYLYRPRINTSDWRNPLTGRETTMVVLVNYRGREWIEDLEVYNLRRMYSQFQNRARIVSFHGETDGIVPLREKESFVRRVENMSLTVLREGDVDGEMFTNTGHGMGSDFLRLFYYCMDRSRLVRETPSEGRLWRAREFSSVRYAYALSEELELSRRDLRS